jgi:hypothetical protein
MHLGGRGAGARAMTIHTPRQPDFFGTDALVGLRVQLDRDIDRRQRCHENIVALCAGSGPHVYELRCVACGRHRGWLPKARADFIRKAIRMIGDPDDAPLIYRDQSSTVVGADGEINTGAPRKRRSPMDMSKYSGGSAFLKVADIKANEPIRVVISDVKLGEFGKPDLLFTDSTKLSVNATNNKILCQAYGTESDQWIGKEIDLVVGMVDFKNQPTETVLVRPISPPLAKKPPPKRKSRGRDMDDEIAF